MAALEKPASEVLDIWLQQGRDDQRSQKLQGLASKRNVSIRHVPKQELERMAGEGEDALRHQGVMARMRVQGTGNDSDLLDMLAALDVPPLLLILDGVQDPRNLGACLRSADAAGVHGVVIPKDRASGLTPAARKTAAGAAESVALYEVTNLARCMRSLQDAGVWLVGLAGEAETGLFQSRLTGPMALVMGAEGKGLRRLTREHCDELLHIPMAGAVESLNVSVATAICLFEAVRQRS